MLLREGKEAHMKWIGNENMSCNCNPGMCFHIKKKSTSFHPQITISRQPRFSSFRDYLHELKEIYGTLELFDLID